MQVLTTASPLFPTGERARLCLAQMLLSSATVLVCDEPTNHLDLEARAYLLEALRCFDGAILLTSHDRHFAAAAATRYVELHEGVLHDPRDGARDGARDGDDDEDGESESDDDHASTHAAGTAAPFFPFAAKYGFLIDGGRGSGSSRRPRARSSREPRPRLASSALGGVLGDGADATSGWEDLIMQRDREEDATLAAAHAAAGGATVAGGARNSAKAAKVAKVVKVDKAAAGRAPRKDVSSKAVAAAGEGGSAPKVRSGSGRSGDGGSSTSGSSTSRSGGGGGGKGGGGGGGGGGGAKRAAGGAGKGKALAPGTKGKGTPFWKGLKEKDAKAKRFED